MVDLPICSVVYLRHFPITKYGSPANPFGSIFEEFLLQIMVALPIHSVVCLRNFVIAISGSPTNPFGSIFEEIFHYKIW